ncbi:MAG: 2-C-methyl-D-erythritol 4-phosphate cytidylyltransferase [Planctomycetota bacterium]
MKVSKLVLAAGRGTRFGGPTPKAFVECAGKSLLRRSLERLAALGVDGDVVLATHPEDRARWVDPELEILRRLGLTVVVDGGATRQESMQRALAASDPEAPLVLVHDAARPLFPLDAARRAIDRAAAVGAALLAVPVPDTLKRVDAAQRVIETVDRSALWQAQTPQVAQRALLTAALQSAAADGFQGTDDMSLLERHGATVEVVLGSPTNLKITTAADLSVAEQMLRAVQDD